MKNVLFLILIFILALSFNINGQTQEVDDQIAKLFKDISGSSEFIETMNYYFSIELIEDISKKEFDIFNSLSRDIRKKDIPTFETRINKKAIELYFKKGKMVYFFSFEKKNDLYFSTVKYYKFKNRKIKKQGRMAFKP